ncbi:uncharacterized protein BX664DRAFT_337090 [Halteromyces radiatus]|uniref:uncharacterized protein n=1 Tax=Halteromyces radiatus TaxID=101107 RepID=UPI0022208B65|nr:uncharacterized protein BX664DRAFT_337090 [Halteromyces radiatus]KAI8084479.1 hypothetical protein BX664DRAFT_337090 [Halteromyces radiatus]
MSTYSLPSLFEVMNYSYPFDHPSSAFQRVSSPPELLHDSEDDGDSLSTSPSLQQHDLYDDHPRRKSMPHRSPSVIQDAFQASALDKSVVFQWDTTLQQTIESHVQSKVICGESLLSALRHRVAMARQQDLPIKKRIIHQPRRQLTATCIALPTHHQPITKHKMSIPVLTNHPVIPTTTDTASKLTVPKQRGRKPLQQNRHTSSGRPSRVKGPCQACQETSDGCMRKAFNWPFPASQIFNDKGKPFVYLCNKCGLRYNKSGGCVCHHCRWVFCKEEKRKAMQYIDKMRRNRPDGHVDPDEDIENFVCSPKYWSCGRPWKVGWVLTPHQDAASEDDEDMDDSTSTSFPISPSL